MSSVGVILAAGASSRMGQPKQLLPYKGTTLIRHVIGNCLDSDLDDIVVVVGSNHDLIREHVEQIPVQTVYNPSWETGMGSSISKGVEYAMNQQNPDCLMVLLADQPLVSTQLINAYLDFCDSKDVDAVGYGYEQKIGVPALFKPVFFDALRQLNEKSGASALLNQPSARVYRYEVGTAALDVDTPEDYDNLMNCDSE